MSLERKNCSAFGQNPGAITAPEAPLPPLGDETENKPLSLATEFTDGEPPPLFVDATPLGPPSLPDSWPNKQDGMGFFDKIESLGTEVRRRKAAEKVAALMKRLGDLGGLLDEHPHLKTALGLGGAIVGSLLLLHLTNESLNAAAPVIETLEQLPKDPAFLEQTADKLKVIAVAGGALSAAFFWLLHHEATAGMIKIPGEEPTDIDIRTLVPGPYKTNSEPVWTVTPLTIDIFRNKMWGEMTAFLLASGAVHGINHHLLHNSKVEGVALALAAIPLLHLAWRYAFLRMESQNFTARPEITVIDRNLGLRQDPDTGKWVLKVDIIAPDVHKAPDVRQILAADWKIADFPFPFMIPGVYKVVEVTWKGVDPVKRMLLRWLPLGVPIKEALDKASEGNITKESILYGMHFLSEQEYDKILREADVVHEALSEAWAEANIKGFEFNRGNWQETCGDFFGTITHLWWAAVYGKIRRRTDRMEAGLEYFKERDEGLRGELKAFEVEMARLQDRRPTPSKYYDIERRRRHKEREIRRLDWAREAWMRGVNPDDPSWGKVEKALREILPYIGSRDVPRTGKDYYFMYEREERGLKRLIQRLKRKRLRRFASPLAPLITE